MKVKKTNYNQLELFFQVYGGEKFYFISFLDDNKRFYLRLDNSSFYDEEFFNCVSPGPKTHVDKAEVNIEKFHLLVAGGPILFLEDEDGHGNRKVFSLSTATIFRVSSQIKLTKFPKILKNVPIVIEHFNPNY